MHDSQKKKGIRCICKIKNKKTHNLVGVMPFSLKLITVVPRLEKHVQYRNIWHVVRWCYKSIKDNNGDGQADYMKWGSTFTFKFIVDDVYM